jgi:septal ring factor EnvC (AmiA/AmiB activator)
MRQEMTTERAQKKLHTLRLKQQELARQLSNVEFIWSGTIKKRFLTCGKPSCACHSDPEARHGPYYYWTTKKAGKTVSRSLSEQQAALLEQWIENRRKLEHILDAMKKLSQEAYEAMLFIMEHPE